MNKYKVFKDDLPNVKNVNSENKKLNFVSQIHSSGCFIACAAMLSGKSYEEVFKILHPKRSIYDIPSNAFPTRRNMRAGLTVPQAIAILPKLGLKAKPTNIRDIQSIRKAGKNALMIVRWLGTRDGHGFVYDSNRNWFLDPNYSYQTADRFHYNNVGGAEIEKVLLIN